VAWLDVNGASFHYVVEGGPGPVVVLLHEMGGTLESWDGVAPELASAGYRVLRYDQRGAGLSEKTRGPITSQMLTDDLGAILGAVGPDGPWHFVTIAAATIQVLMFAAQRRADVASQTFCNPLAGVAPARAAQLEERARLAEQEGIRASLPVTLERSYPADLGDPATYQRYRGRYLANDPVCFASAHRALAATDVSALVPDVRCPTMVVAGRLDQVRPVTASAEFAASIPGARFEVIEAGHMLAAQAPELLGALLRDFIGQVRAGQVSPAAARAGGPA
jgi:3-oxoadipate enol-lactonase